MAALAPLGGLLLLGSLPQAPSSSPPPGASRGAALSQPVILFLVDNSASLPPLDPQEKRVEALEKIFGFLTGQRYRLVLFGARREIAVDDVTQYNNRGQWTDLYFAFDKARELMEGYPKGTEFRIVCLTDGILDPDPEEWKPMQVPPGSDLRAYVIERLLFMIGDLKVPLYVILIGDPPKEGTAPGDVEQSPGLVLDMVRAANGAAASRTAQTLAGFFGDDGLLLKKFIYRVPPQEGLKKIETVVRRVAAPPRPGVELRIFSFLLVPLAGVLLFLLGWLVRSFPGPGDVEIAELSLNQPVHVAADHGGRQGLSQVAEVKDAAATFTYQPPGLDLAGVGLDTLGADPLTQLLIPLPLDELRRKLEQLSEDGGKEEKIFALNLDYMAKNMDAETAERVLETRVLDRRRTPAVDFLRAKVHLLGNDGLRKKVIDPRVHYVGYGRSGAKKELVPGAPVSVGRYGFIVRDVVKGGRKDVKLVLYYDKVPSLLGLKAILPDAIQRVLRLRRSSQRVVT